MTGVQTCALPIWIMLCYTPLHYLVFAALRRHQRHPVVVMTSANRSDEPLAKDEREVNKLRGVADYFLSHNRRIYMRCDDSIVRVYNKKEYIVRKARGYVPDFLPFTASRRILGCGAELKSTFAITKNNFIITSQYLGDLKNASTHKFFLNTLSHFKKVFSFQPEIVACDYHPNYLSTQYACSLPKVTLLTVQHHHAHMASCMLENNIEDTVIGVVFDGMGLGLDECAWGGEFLVGDRSHFLRAGFFDYFGLVGADAAVKQPLRIALYILYALWGEHLKDCGIDFIKEIDERRMRLLLQLIRRKHFVLTSSVGRMFDALSSLLRLKDTVSYEAEAAISLEMLAQSAKIKYRRPYSFDIIKQPGVLGRSKGTCIIKWQPLFRDIIIDLQQHRAAALIAWRFHYTLANIIEQFCCQLRHNYGINKVGVNFPKSRIN